MIRKLLILSGDYSNLLDDLYSQLSLCLTGRSCSCKYYYFEKHLRCPLLIGKVFDWVWRIVSVFLILNKGVCHLQAFTTFWLIHHPFSEYLVIVRRRRVELTSLRCTHQSRHLICRNQVYCSQACIYLLRKSYSIPHSHHTNCKSWSHS